jgi:hypothetical protein
MLAPLLLALIGPAAPAVTPAPPVQQQSLRVWLNRQGTLDRGDKIRVYTRAAEDGYLFVLHVEPNGRVRALFPLDPFDDNFIRAGQDYEIRGRGDREAFKVYETSGAGTVFAALSPDPVRFDALVLNSHWDYRAADWNMTGDPEADLTALMGRLTAGGRFEYDVQRYVVGGYVAYGGGDWYSPGLYDPYYYGHSWYGGTGFSINFRFGHGYRRYYDPFYWDPWAWDPWWYSSPCWGGCGFYGWPYYYTPVYYGYPYYGYPYYAPNRYVYVTSPGYGGYGGYGGYTFKSTNDRFGLAPDPVGVRRRALASGAGQATSSGRAGVAPTGRRTPTATAGSPGSSAPDARGTPARRPASQPAAGSPSGTRSPAPRATPERRGTNAPARGATPARPPASRPAATPTRRQISQSDADAERRPSVGERLDDGSYRLPTPPRRGAEVAPQARVPVGTLERRAETEPRPVPLSGDRTPTSSPPRGLRIADDAPAPRRTADGGAPPQNAAGSSRMPTSTRQVEPRAAPAPSRAPANVSDGRRAPTTSPAPSGRAPTTRSAPTPSNRGPSARPAPRAPTRSAPSRPSSGGPSRRSK